MGDSKTTKPQNRIGRQRMQWRVVLCGSMSAYGEMLRIQKILQRSGIPTVVPVAEDHIKHSLTPEEFRLFKRKVSYQYLRKIRHPSTFAVVAINCDKYDIRNYVGPNTFAEIAVAFAQSKRIYLYQDMPEAFEDELQAWAAIPLCQEFSKLVGDFRAFCKHEDAQLLLFS